MPPEIPNLWPPLPPVGEKPPMVILREQASQLGTRTNGLVIAEVRTRAAGEEFVHSFDLVAPAWIIIDTDYSSPGMGLAFIPSPSSFRGKPTRRPHARNSTMR